jgi:cell division protein FtsI/penicillin-binding protein 2
VAPARKKRAALATGMGPNATGRRGNVPGFRTGGKTGTAHKNTNGSYNRDLCAASFVGMLPSDDPAFVCVVVIDEPLTDKVKPGGGTVAAPVWQRIAARTAAYLNLTPTEPIEEKPELAAAGPQP